jgi:glycosyltransferase involved in cell wall biosynthesis
MSEQVPKIVVITPIRNESWILDRFLCTTSYFADHIIIADQNSTDNSVEICKKYPKVTLIGSDSDEWIEAARQLLLIQTARELVPEHKIILALDADEILAANATESLGWQMMLKAEPGTVLYFEKPDLFSSPEQCVRYDTPWPLGYVDDGAEHETKEIHGVKVPRPDYALRMYIHDVKILHYGLTRLDAQRSKVRRYSIVENMLKTNRAFSRRFMYSSTVDYLLRGTLEKCPKEWFEKWESLGIDMFSIPHHKYYWQDYEVLKSFNHHGTTRFWMDDIWDFDWENFRIYARSKGYKDIPESSIQRPPKAVLFGLKVLDRFYRSTLSLRSYLKRWTFPT